MSGALAVVSQKGQELYNRLPEKMQLSDRNKFLMVASTVVYVCSPRFGKVAVTYSIADTITDRILNQMGLYSGSKINQVTAVAINSIVAVGATFAVGGYLNSETINTVLECAFSVFALRASKFL